MHFFQTLVFLPYHLRMFILCKFPPLVGHLAPHTASVGKNQDQPRPIHLCRQAAPAGTGKHFSWP